MRLIKLWNNADREILIDMDFKPEPVLNRSNFFHKYIYEGVLMMAIFAVIIVYFG